MADPLQVQSAGPITAEIERIGGTQLQVKCTNLKEKGLTINDYPAISIERFPNCEVYKLSRSWRREPVLIWCSSGSFGGGEYEVMRNAV